MNAILALAIVVGAAQAPQVSDPFMTDRVAGPLGKELDTRLERFTRYGFSGTVLVVRRNRIVLLKGYGLANIERGIPNTGATRFEMNSMTKMFTGVAILQLAAGGHLRLRDPVARYLRDLPPSKQGATIEQLAAHTSGLVVKGAPLAGDSRETFVRDIARTPLESPPGQRYRYTNAGFSLLASVIETVSGETYEQYLRRHLFAAAGMDTALFAMRSHRTTRSSPTATWERRQGSSRGPRTHTSGGQSAPAACGLPWATSTGGWSP